MRESWIEGVEVEEVGVTDVCLGAGVHTKSWDDDHPDHCYASGVLRPSEVLVDIFALDTNMSV